MRSSQSDTKNLRTITGYVAANGTIVSGVGFIVQRTAVGLYTIRFVPSIQLLSFSAIPIAGANRTYGGNIQPDLNSISLYGSICNTGALSDEPFWFTAVGR